MKYIPFIIFALTFCINTNAQEVQSDLLFNRAYTNDYNYKSNSGLLDLCNQTQIAFEITSIKNPTCGSNDGSISIEITPAFSEYKIYLNDTLITETAGSNYEITGVGSGGFLVRVNAASALGCEQFLTIDNEGEEPINPQIFKITDAFCGTGKIQRIIAVGTEVLDYEIFNLKNESVGAFSFFVGAQNLDPGNYYIREKVSSGSCSAYLGFTVKNIPSNTVPFVDDFSKELVYPNANRWADKQAFVNRSFANSPYTLGVVTLDGLNEFGQPYRVNNNPVTASADSLTTHPFCLENDFQSGDSLFLSFLYQPQGISDFPDGTDSLFVEIMDSDSTWHEIWKISGDSAKNNLEFTQVVLGIADDTASTTEATFIFDGFRIRFRNIATATGLNDPWHLDYIQLQESRFDATSIQNDIAFVYDMRPLLKNYYSMPWDQFYDHQTEEFVASINYTARINDNDPNTNAEVKYDLFELCDSLTIDSSGDLAFAGELNTLIEGSIPLNISELSDLGADKGIEENVVIRCNLSFDTDNDFLKQNDTLEYNQIFSNYFAYDDGTAEKAYGLLGPGAQLAIQYETNEPTTLQGIQIYFTHIVGDVSQNRFSIKAWTGLDKNNDTPSLAREDTVLMSKSGLTPYYTNEIGGFTTYLFEKPMTVNGRFYIGIEQVDKEILNIGQDFNNLVTSTSPTSLPGDLQHLFAAGKMFYNTNGIWTESILPGAVMIRPLVGERELMQTGISTLEKMNISVYPNPTNGFLNIAGVENLFNYNVSIYDMTGKQLQHFTQENDQINVSSLASGMYMIQLTDNQNKTLAHSKFVKH